MNTIQTCALNRHECKMAVEAYVTFHLRRQKKNMFKSNSVSAGPQPLHLLVARPFYAALHSVKPPHKSTYFVHLSVGSC